MSRRKALGVAATAGVAVGAASLVGCGGGGDSGDGGVDTASLIHKPKDTTASAKPGGTYAAYTTRDVSGFDYIGASGNIDRGEANFSYSRLFKWKPGVGEQAKGEIDGDLAASWEIAPDDLSITVKLRPEAKWDARTPTNSRQLSADDVKFSLDRMKAVSVYRNDWFAEVNANGGLIRSYETPDKSTVKINFAFPLAAVFDYFANTLGLFIMPTESDGKFDPRKEMRGTGAWILDKYEPSVAMQYSGTNW
jgi:ABC-type transport system substrate-binding protein